MKMLGKRGLSLEAHYRAFPKSRQVLPGLLLCERQRFVDCARKKSPFSSGPASAAFNTGTRASAHGSAARVFNTVAQLRVVTPRRSLPSKASAAWLCRMPLAQCR